MNSQSQHNPDSAPRYSTLADWLAWMESLHPSEIDLGLVRISDVAKRLGFASLVGEGPRTGNGLKIVTVAGTNGKGSCVFAMESLLRAENKTVGSFCSPHFLYYNERIKVNGVAVADDVICSAFSAIDKARQDTSLTYFEFGALAAMLIFWESNLDYWLLEVGLGGRLDAVNILTPDIAVVTSIALDHEKWLGNTREAIALEKAGILREGIPFVCSELDAPRSLLDRAKHYNVRLFQLGDHFRVSKNHHTSIELYVSGNSEPITVEEPLLPLPSMAAACQVVGLLGYPLTDSAGQCLSGLTLTGRFSRHARAAGKGLILDVAHNPAATTLLSARLNQYFGRERLDAVVSIMDDKDIEGAFRPLIESIERWYIAALPDNPRAAEPEQIQAILLQLGVSRESITLSSCVCAAIEMADENEKAGELLVFGSFFTVANALAFIERGK